MLQIKLQLSPGPRSPSPPWHSPVPHTNLTQLHQCELRNSLLCQPDSASSLGNRDGDCPGVAQAGGDSTDPLPHVSRPSVAVPPRRQGGISLIRASIHHSTKVSETRREALRTGNFKSTAKEMLHQYLLASSSRRKRSCLVDISTCAALGRTHCYQLVSCSHRVSESVGIIISNLCTVCKQSCTQKTSCSSLHPR